MSAKLFLQGALVDLLEPLAVQIYDHTPQDAVYPYITISDFSSAEQDDTCTRRWQISVTISVYSQYKGFKELFDIQEMIDNVVSWYKLPGSEYSIIMIAPSSDAASKSGDGLTREGSQTFIATVEKN